MSESRRPRLDTPRDTRRTIVRRPSVDADAFGVFAESFAPFVAADSHFSQMPLSSGSSFMRMPDLIA